MTSKIVVNNIEADSGINTITFGSEISATKITTSSTSAFSSGLNVTGGSVGIGTTNPSGKLDVDSTINTYLNVTTSNNGSGAGIVIISNNNNEFVGYANSLRFGTVTGKNAAGWSEKIRFTSGGDVQVSNGNLVFSTSGTGIDFSATADGGGTTTSELLDDYEEGTFTPDVNNSGYASRWNSKAGRYRKVGSKVTVWINCDGGTQPRSGAGTGLLIISGLPFAINSSLDGNYVLGIIGYNKGGGGSGSVDANVNYAGGTVRVRIGGSDQSDQIDYVSACFSYFV